MAVSKARRRGEISPSGVASANGATNSPTDCGVVPLMGNIPQYLKEIGATIYTKLYIEKSLCIFN
jgi:hypothetical protein